MKRLGAILCLLILLASCGKAPEGPLLTETEGLLLLAADGTPILVTEDGEAIVLSVEAEAPFDGLHSGDRISVRHDGVEETYPAKTGAYDWALLEEGSLDDVPEETLANLEGLGWNFCREDHGPAAEPQTVADPVSGYCGNTVTTVTLNGEEYSFWGGDSVTLTDILINRAYDPVSVCRCLPEFTVDTEFGNGYGVNLTESYVRCEAGQAPLTAEETEEIRGILQRNCGGGTP